MADREAIMDALAALVATSTNYKGDAYFKTLSRRFKQWQQDPGAIIPLLPMAIVWESPNAEVYNYNNSRGIPPTRHWNARLLLYDRIPPTDRQNIPDADTPGSTIVNKMLNAVEAALDPGTLDGVQTLGGLVLDCRIEGEIIKVLGDIDPSGICAALVPISILVQ